MNIGIDKIGFYTPKTFLNMSDLAVARNIEVGKYTIGLGQEQMAVPNCYEDAVTLAANAANALLDDADRQAIDLILVGSESGVDNSKSIAVYVQSLANLNASVRAVELKQACYGATMALQLAKGHILQHPNSKVLVIASDIAKYGLNTPGEPTQGAGAVAMLVSANPKIAIIENDSACLTEDIMDFWRPVYSDLAFADGKFSTEKYMHFFETVFRQYERTQQKSFADFSAICFHQPFTKLGFKALSAVIEKSDASQQTKDRLYRAYEYSKTYNKRVGNIYTGSLYLSLISLLEQCDTLQATDRIGLFSYGSGAVGEFFSIVLQPNFKQFLRRNTHETLLNNREALTIDAYEAILSKHLPKDGSTVVFDNVPTDVVALTGMSQHIRQYQKPVSMQ